MRRLIQTVVILASTGLGILGGRYVLVPALRQVIPHLSWLLPHSDGPAKDGFGDMITGILTAGYSLGLAIGVGMTLALFSGLLAGIALARRVKISAPTAALNIA